MKIISQTAEYALRAMVHLAATQIDSREATTALTLPQIAEATQVPISYLSKVLQNLGRAGLVTSQRGAGGGFSLVRPPQSTSIYDVVQAVDPLQRILECPLGLEAHATQLCPLHKQLDDAISHIETSFRSTTIIDLLEGTTSSVPLGFMFRKTA